MTRTKKTAGAADAPTVEESRGLATPAPAWIFAHPSPDFKPTSVRMEPCTLSPRERAFQEVAWRGWWDRLVAAALADERADREAPRT